MERTGGYFLLVAGFVAGAKGLGMFLKEGPIGYRVLGLVISIVGWIVFLVFLKRSIWG